LKGLGSHLQCFALGLERAKSIGIKDIAAGGQSVRDGIKVLTK
jgi:hypothetical protein